MLELAPLFLHDTGFWVATSCCLEMSLMPCLLLLFLKGLRKLQEIHGCFFSPFLKSQLKIKSRLKLSPAHSAVCRCDANQHPGLGSSWGR